MKIDDIIKNRRTRKAAGKLDLSFFSQYYMRHYLSHPNAPFHYDIDEAIKEPGPDDPESSLIIGYRESAKTSRVRARVLQAILYSGRKNIHWISVEKDAAEKNLFAIARELQTNKRILADFGQLFFDEKGKDKKTRKKQINHFITENGVSVKAGSVKISMRGNLDEENRPDLVILDDIENMKTVRSATQTKATMEFIKEMLAGQATGCQTIVLANRISKNGVIAEIEKQANQNPDTWSLLDIPIMKRGADVSNWPERIVMTRLEEIKHNKTVERRYQVKSIESIKRKLGSSAFETEMMNNPQGIEGGVVKREWIKRFQVSRLVRDKDGNFGYIFPESTEATKIKRVCGAIDPAVSTKETSDDRSICWGGVATRKIMLEDEEIEEKKFFIFACIAGKWSLPVFTEKLARGRDFFKPHRIGCESNGVQDVFRVLFKNAGISTVALNPDRDKLRRMSANVADVEFGDVLFPDDGSTTDLEDEMVGFTGEAGGLDNRVDTFNYLLQMLKSGGGFAWAVLD